MNFSLKVANAENKVRKLHQARNDVNMKTPKNGETNGINYGNGLLLP